MGKLEECDRIMKCHCLYGECNECVARRIARDEVARALDIVTEEMQRHLFFKENTDAMCQVDKVMSKVIERLRAPEKESEE